MITKLKVQNFKSIVNADLELANVNVLIGDNGAGKTNLLEAIGMLSACKNGFVKRNEIVKRGIRPTAPLMTFSAFSHLKYDEKLSFELDEDHALSVQQFDLVPDSFDPNEANWILDGYFEGKFAGASLPNDSVTTYKAKEPPVTAHQNKAKAKKRAAMFSTFLQSFKIYKPNIHHLQRNESEMPPTQLGIHGEGLLSVLGNFSKSEWKELQSYRHLISFIDQIGRVSEGDSAEQAKNLSKSKMPFVIRGKHLEANRQLLSLDDLNDGVLFVLFYLVLFISRKEAKFFAIENIDQCLNPKMCRILIKELTALAIKYNKQVLITTHNPAVLDGINLFDDRQRLFVVARNDEGHTVIDRIRFKPNAEKHEFKLSEMWSRGLIGGLAGAF